MIVEPRADQSPGVLGDETSGRPKRNSQVFDFQLLVHRSKKGKGQVLAAPQRGARRMEDQLPTDSVAIEHGQPGSFENDLHESNQGPDADSDNREPQRAAEHPGTGLRRACDRQEQDSSDQAPQAATDQAIADFRLGTIEQSIGHADPQARYQPAQSAGKADSVKTLPHDRTPCAPDSADENAGNCSFENLAGATVGQASHGAQSCADRPADKAASDKDFRKISLQAQSADHRFRNAPAQKSRPAAQDRAEIDLAGKRHSSNSRKHFRSGVIRS